MQNKRDLGTGFTERIVRYERSYLLSRMYIACSIWSMGLWINGNWVGHRISSGHVRTGIKRSEYSIAV